MANTDEKEFAKKCGTEISASSSSVPATFLAFLTGKRPATLRPEIAQRSNRVPNDRCRHSSFGGSHPHDPGTSSGRSGHKMLHTMDLSEHIDRLTAATPNDGRCWSATYLAEPASADSCSIQRERPPPDIRWPIGDQDSQPMRDGVVRPGLASPQRR